MPDITPAELHQRQQAGETPTIIDVRETWEHEEGRIAGAQNIPLNSLPDKARRPRRLKRPGNHCALQRRRPLASAKAY
jgi:rhodanese-related sulfurtransferase